LHKEYKVNAKRRYSLRDDEGLFPYENEYFYILEHISKPYLK